MHDYIVGGLARSHQEDLLREVLHEEQVAATRQAAKETPSDATTAGSHAPVASATHVRHWVATLIPHPHPSRQQPAHHH